MMVSIQEKEAAPRVERNRRAQSIHVAVVSSLCVPPAGQLPYPDMDSCSTEFGPAPWTFLPPKKLRGNSLFPFRVCLRKSNTTLCLRTPDWYKWESADTLEILRRKGATGGL
ncbi:uncharacterized protein V6R79_020589 [Siganus canaliculatus]